MKRIEGFGIPVTDLLVRCDDLDAMLAHYRAIEHAEGPNTQSSLPRKREPGLGVWIPAFAGMTKNAVKPRFR